MSLFALQTNLYITNLCNRQCENCYYPHNDSPMTYQMANEIAAWIATMCIDENVKEYHAHFLGGEPLLNQGVMSFLIDKLETYLPNYTEGSYYGKYVVFTNGDFLSPHNLEKLKGQKAMIMLNPTSDSLQVVEEKMNLIKAFLGGVSLAVVADETNLRRLPDLAKLAVGHRGHIRINRLYHGGTMPGYVEEYRKQMHRVFDILLAAKKPMWPNFIMESSYVTWDSPKNPNACGRWFLAFDPDGSIRSCNADMDTKMGHIRTHHSMKDFIFTHRWSAKNLPECQDCPYITHCQGGCPYTRKLAYGTYDKRTPFCKAFKELFPRLYELKERWVEYNGRTPR